MKAKQFLFPFVLFIAILGLSGCVRENSVLVSTQDLRFGLKAESQTFIIHANCKWEVSKNDDADWYTISPMSGRAKDSIITVTVNDYTGGDFRGSSFVIGSPGWHIRRTVFVSQNKLDFDGMINKVFGLTKLERWNTDYYGQIIEETYKPYEYDPYDTTTGQRMYFFEQGQGIQRRVVSYDSIVYYAFDYEYDSDNSILHIAFHLENDGLESYDPEVLCASDSLYRVFHEFKPDFWERADMRKVGTLVPEEMNCMKNKVTKRKKGEPIFITK